MPSRRGVAAIVVALALVLLGATGASAAVGQSGFSFANSVSDPTGGGPASVSASFFPQFTPAERILVTDPAKNAIWTIDKTGAFISPFSSGSSHYFTGNGYTFSWPWQAALNGSEVDVSDVAAIQGNPDVRRVLLSDGSSPNGTFTSIPSGFDPRGFARAPSGDIAVADRANNRIDIFNAAGVYQTAYTRSGPGLLSPRRARRK